MSLYDDTAAAQPLYRREQHAAHYAPGHPEKGHDLETWTVPGGPQPERVEGVPADAEYHHGYRKDGVQHWVFVRTAPLTGTCSRCEPRGDLGYLREGLVLAEAPPAIDDRLRAMLITIARLLPVAMPGEYPGVTVHGSDDLVAALVALGGSLEVLDLSSGAGWFDTAIVEIGGVTFKCLGPTRPTRERGTCPAPVDNNGTPEPCEAPLAAGCGGERRLV